MVPPLKSFSMMLNVAELGSSKVLKIAPCGFESCTSTVSVPSSGTVSSTTVMVKVFCTSPMAKLSVPLAAV